MEIQGPNFGDRKNQELSVEEQYELGLKYLKRGYYVKALEEFNQIRNYHRDDPYAVKAELAIADLYFSKSEWDQARLAYEDFLRLHPRHEDCGLCRVPFRTDLLEKSAQDRSPGSGLDPKRGEHLDRL